MLKICGFCTKTFQARNRKGRKNPTSSFCCSKCYWDSMTILLECHTCKKEFKRTSNGVLKYCSKDCMMNGEFIKLQSESHKGKIASQETRKKLSQQALGRDSIQALNKPEIRQKAIEAARKVLMGRVSPKKGVPQYNMRGENHFAWKGGAGTERHQLMGKIEYKLWRAAVFEKDKYTCQSCYAKGVYLNADHIQSWADYPELRYTVENGQTLCNSCHYFKTFGRIMPADLNWGKFK